MFEMEYLFGAIIGALLVTFLVTRILNFIVRLASKNRIFSKRKLMLSYFVSSIVILTLASFQFGIVKSFFIYIPFLFIWLMLDLMAV